MKTSKARAIKVEWNMGMKQRQEPSGKKTRRGRSKEKQKWRVGETTPEVGTTPSSPPLHTQSVIVQVVSGQDSKLGTGKDKVIGESSGATPSYLQSMRSRSGSSASRTSNSDLQHDSSDVESSDSDLEEGEFTTHEPSDGWFGKIWMVWHSSLFVTIISKSLQMITAEVAWPTTPQTKVFI
ncbi:hypothetical protein F2Q68_00040294 [Brassica cretica]|uniref:Uncharacterized protein n=1 Tax=Brassica cretica TaxID=69181 RepID=A0A8S9MKX8_BRACR|nr:hypothetical protein F2Q68_00040294 [Brassica cretica]